MLTLLFLLVLLLSIFAYKFYNNYKQEKDSLDKMSKLYDLEKSKAIKLHDKYSKIINIEEEVDKIQIKLRQIEEELQKSQENYEKKTKEHAELLNKKMLLEEDIEVLEYGLYQPHFEFNTSDEYKQAIDDNYNKQKAIVKDGSATISSIEWTVEGSKAKGAQMVKKASKLMLRAFNGECDALIIKTRWNNFFKMKERMKKAFEAINKLGETNSISINDKYLDLKEEQLYLTYEYDVKKYEEKEEQALIRERIREEKEAQEEYEKVRKEAEQEEEHYQIALNQARKEIENAKGEEISYYKDEIKRLEQSLKEAQERRERAISQAQLTKAGHIYVISNIGSFGENIYKIGMTRRLEPLDRVRELGDASVPFRFDVHALIYSENAPELENKLHNIFREKSVNQVNYKKEFFNVSLDEIKKAVEENYGEFKFTMFAEARDYRETLEILKAKMHAQ